MTRITRVEVIDENGRSYVNWKEDNDITLSYQDDGRTLKVFVNKVKPKSPVEEAYKDWWGEYPGTEIWTSDDETRWQGFQAGYEFAYAISTAKEVMEKVQEEQKWDAVCESVKWCQEHREESVEDYLRPQTPEQIEKSLKEAFVKAQQTEEWKETQRKIDAPKESWMNKSDEELIAILEKNPPEFLKFELGKTLEELICKCMVDYNSIIPVGLLEDILNNIEKWLPDFQSHEGTQSASVIDLVDGYNDALTKIKSKLRNKK